MPAKEQRVPAGVAAVAREPGKARAHEKYQRLVDDCKTLPPTPTAVVHPCDQSSLQGAVDAARMGLIAPILVGPRTRIEEVARQNRIDISGLPIVDAPYSHASAEKAVDLVREGKAEALMKGSLHTDELMGGVVRRDSALRTAHRVSHCFKSCRSALCRGIRLSIRGREAERVKLAAGSVDSTNVRPTRQVDIEPPRALDL